LWLGEGGDIGALQCQQSTPRSISEAGL